MKVKNPWIAKEKFENISKDSNQLEYNKWVEFIDNNNDYFIWVENTESGKDTLANLDRIPKSFVEGIVNSYTKKKAYAEFNSEKGNYEIVVQFNEDLNVIGTTFMKDIQRHHLEKLNDLARHMNAQLLNNSQTIISDEYISSLD